MIDIKKNKKILVLAALFPPDVHGGAEISAHDLCRWLVAKGFEVGVLTTAKSPTEQLDGATIDGMRIWRVFMPRLYPMFYHGTAPRWAKPFWHFQDHFDPANRRILRRVLEAFRPDYINIQVLQGLGYNCLKEIAKCGIPTTYFLHDLGLACVRMSMFKKDKECLKQCLACKASSAYKAHLVKMVPTLGFCAPSNALLEKLGSFFPLSQFPSTSIRNANQFPLPSKPRTNSPIIRILYVGRLHPQKGVKLFLEAAASLAEEFRFTVTVVGTGPEEGALRQAYEHFDWCRFTGFITQADISDLMMESDLLSIPSIWLENSPGVVFHALGLGLPVIGSNKGGIPELVTDGINGRLVPPGDFSSWQQALRDILANPGLIEQWKFNIKNSDYNFNQDSNGNKFLQFQDKVG